MEEKIPYRKTPISIEQQLEKLKSRGLIVDDEELAKSYLSNISYYRLRAYTFPFQDNENEDADHRFFRKDIHFCDIIDLYCFDRRLRSLIFNAIEKIEVAVRAKMTQIYCDKTNDSHWFEDESLFLDKSYFVTNEVKKEDGTTGYEKEEVFHFNILADDIEKEVGRSNEDFIKHYYNRYSSPEMPPAWMTLETITLGTLSRLYELLINDDNKKELAYEFGLTNWKVFANWLHGISTLRNCCAHHSRIWNKRFIINITLPYNTNYSFLSRDIIESTRNNKLFAFLCCIQYILKIISPDSNFKSALIDLIQNAGKLVMIKDMGFPEDGNWRHFDVWKD